MRKWARELGVLEALLLLSHKRNKHVHLIYIGSPLPYLEITGFAYAHSTPSWNSGGRSFQGSANCSHHAPVSTPDSPASRPLNPFHQQDCTDGIPLFVLCHYLSLQLMYWDRWPSLSYGCQSQNFCSKTSLNYKPKGIWANLAILMYVRSNL